MTVEFTRGTPSFFNGKKRFAKCTETYVDQYNCVPPRAGESCGLTYGKYYEVIDEGQAVNESNAFNTRYKMIFIKDDYNKVWGLPEDSFDMTDEYANQWLIDEKSNPKLKEEATKVPFNSKVDELEDDYDEDDYDEEYEEDEILQAPLKVKIAPIVKKVEVPEKPQIQIRKVKTLSHEESRDWLSQIKSQFFSERPFRYLITNFNHAYMQTDKIKELLADEAFLVIGYMDTYRTVFVSDDKVVVYKMGDAKFENFQNFQMGTELWFEDYNLQFIKVYLGSKTDLSDKFLDLYKIVLK